MQVAIRPLSYYQNLLMQPMEYCGVFRGPYQDPGHAIPVLIPDNIVEGQQ